MSKLKRYGIKLVPEKEEYNDHTITVTIKEIDRPAAQEKALAFANKEMFVSKMGYEYRLHDSEREK